VKHVTTDDLLFIQSLSPELLRTLGSNIDEAKLARLREYDVVIKTIAEPIRELKREVQELKTQHRELTDENTELKRQIMELQAFAVRHLERR